MKQAIPQFHIVSKPIGPACNMACDYCFYSEKKVFYPETKKMTDQDLERFVRTYLEAHPGPEVNFLWQGGEPMLLGIDFYRRAVLLQQKYRGGKRVTNSIQTNGTLLNREWCRFLRDNRFLVGVSLDGPAQVHDAYRKMRSGRASFPEVLRGVQLMQSHRVQFNVTTCVSDVSARDPLAVYRFFKELGVQYLQFAPIVERKPAGEDRTLGLTHASPDTALAAMAPGSVDSLAYGEFLSTVFDQWVRQDVGKMYVMNFEWALAAWLGLPTSYCIFAERCGNAFAAEHNGDLYACDHYVYPEYRLGNLYETPVEDMMDSPACRAFAEKKGNLPEKCLVCDFRFACHGECPKNRFLPGGENYLCEGYRHYFEHIRPYMEHMAQLYRAGKPVDLIMKGN